MENFNLMAENFDTETRIKRATVIADKIRSYIINGDRKSAIEYGCGTGLVGLRLTNVFNRLLLVDSFPEMIKQVKLKLRKLNDQSITVFCCDFMDDMPEIPHVDYIFSSLVMHHITDIKKFLHRLYGLLLDGGRLLFVDIDKDDGGFHAKYSDFNGHNGFEHSELIDLAMAVGFSKVEIETFYHDVKIFNGIENPYSLFIMDAVK